MSYGKFATAINCMDGRVQEPVIMWFKIRKGFDFVDMITEAGPIKLLAERDETAMESIKYRTMISVAKHESGLIAVIGHHDCAGNPVSREEQLQHIEKSVEAVKSWDLGAAVVGLYVNDRWDVEVVLE